MNYTRPIINRIFNRHQPLMHNNTQRIIIKHQLPIITTATTTTNFFSTTSITQIKPGSPIPGLESIYPKNTKDPSKDKTPIYLNREEYPSWVSQLMVPLPTLAELRRMPIEEASDKDMKRYLKLVRRAKIKANNEERRKK